MEGSERAVGRCSSCRGVAFESNRDMVSLVPPPAPLPPPETDQQGGGRWVWIPWGVKISLDMFPLSQMFDRSMSHRSSSHFCDLDLADYATSTEVVDVPEGWPQSFVHDIETAQDQEMPRRRRSRLSIILLDQGLFTVYKRLFATCFVLNIIALALAAIGCFPYAKNHATLFSIGNILALCLCRSEAFLRFVFYWVVRILGRPCVPLRVKTATTSFLQSLGGIHSGCGVSSLVWLVYALVQTFQDRHNTSPAIIAVASTILYLLFVSSVAAFPLVRHSHHNVFERTHRFAGWAALFLLWVFMVLTNCYQPVSKTYRFEASMLVNKQEFWLTYCITAVIFLPWMTVKRVPVKVTTASNHACLIKFEGGVEAGLLGRISPSPYSEWHAFGIISDGKKDHMMLAGAVGDFTKSLVYNPPSHLWVRKVHFAGLPYLVNLYGRVVLVATGSGIAVFLSFLLQPSSAEVCLLWVAKGIEQNFGKEIKEMVSGFPKDKVIVHDTAVSGRPDVAKMSVETAKNWRAEVVIVTSNPEGSRDVVKACEVAGIPAFGPIWDS